MTADHLMDQAFRRWEHLLAAWNFYLLVAAGVVAVAMFVPAARTDRRIFRTLAAGWVLFAWTHALGLLYILKQWAAVAAVLKSRLDPTTAGRLAGAGLVEAPAGGWVIPFHLLVDAAVLVTVWVFCRPTKPSS